MEIKQGEAVPQSYLDWFRADLRHAQEWRKEARTAYEFRDGRHWDEADRLVLEDQKRPVITFNRIGAIVDAVSGQEISNRQEVRYIPRVNAPAEQGGDNEVTELYTSASQWFRDRADADDNDSEAFRDTITSGMGWTETRLDYEDNPDGDLRDDRLDPFEMVWDYNARKQNLVDATRVWRVRQFPIAEARAMVEGLGGGDKLTDEDLNADWAADAVFDGSTVPHSSESVRDRRKATRGADGKLTEVVLVHCQWIEREMVWRLVNPANGEKVSLNEADFAKLKAEVPPDMWPQVEKTAVRQKRKVRYQAILGAKVLKVMPTACPDHFNFKCITGKRDQNKGQFFGIVRGMQDPSSWSNKLFSQILHIINSQAKGGILAERGAFDNDAAAEESWARSDRITWMKNGSLSGTAPRWAQKPVAQAPQALQYLMEIAGTAVHQVSGVNLELLGQREATQAGVLEYQRRQAGLTILQPLFDALKSYRREQGELILWYIKNDLSDGRLIRIVGKQEGEYVKLSKDPNQGSLEYDIIVDDAPTSPNQKEKNWQLITQMLPVIKDMLTPQVMLALAEDSPLPSAVVKKLAKLAEQAASGPGAEMAQKMQQLEAMVLETKAELQKAQAAKAMADAQTAATQQGPDPQAEMARKAQESQANLAIKASEAQANTQIKRETAQATVAIQAQQQAETQELARQAAMADQAMAADQAAHDMALAEAKAVSDATNRERVARATAKRKPAK